MSSTHSFQSSSGRDERDSTAAGSQSDSIESELLDDLEKFQTTSFSVFLHYMLGLVDAIPKRDSPPYPDVIQRDLEVCLKAVIAAMEDKDNKSLMLSIDQALECYCKGESELNQREGLTKAINAALLLLHPLSIGNSRAVADPRSDDSLLFITRKPSRIGNERMPSIVCAARRDATGMSREKDSEQLLENNYSLGWKPHYSCWEALRGSDLLDVPRPANWGQSYGAIPLKEYEHTVNHNPPPSMRLDSGGEVCQNAHPRNTQRCAEDAANVFYDTLGRDHIMNVAVNDEILRVWYFDHESPIQTSAFNFIKDLPYLLLFLFALQRFSLTDWGFIEQLAPANRHIIEPIDLSDQFHDNNGSKVFFQCSGIGHRNSRQLSLCGRTTHVVFGHVIAGEKDTATALKLLWRKKARVPEGVFLRQATKRFSEKGCLDACKYLPTLLADQDIVELSTDVIRRQLLLPVKEGATLLPYFIVLPRYQPLAVRTTDWEAFLKDYLELIYCHLVLWSVGIEHGDISPWNLMWDPITRMPKLCDFDLSHFTGDTQTGFKNTGTKMFMAMDLLTAMAYGNTVERMYRHELESFIAVLVWFMICCDNGVVRDTDALMEWNSPLLGTCILARRATYSDGLQDKLHHIPVHIQFIADNIVHRCERFWYEADWRQYKMNSVKILKQIPGSRTVNFTERELNELKYINSPHLVSSILSNLADIDIVPAPFKDIYRDITGVLPVLSKPLAECEASLKDKFYAWGI